MQADRGYLFVVGGAEDKVNSKLILRRFSEVAGGPDARILVITTASPAHADQARAQYQAAFADLGVPDVTLLDQRSRGDALDPALEAALERATGVFFTGGDQLRLVSILGGTPFTRTLSERFHAGLHLGGTSAGASAMSTVMIARGRGRRAPRLSTVRLSPGLGILRRVIVDQHFQERDRLGRLVTAVLKNPGFLGFGIDEDTAFVVDPAGDVEVIGRGTLTVVDGHDLRESNIADARDHQPLAFSGLTLHVLAEGWSFNVDTREVRTPPLVVSGDRS